MQTKPIKILLIEDMIEDAVIIKEMLKDNSKNAFELNHVNRLKTGFETLFKESFDILLLDLNLPDSWGFDTFIRTYDQAQELPIVILSGFDEEIAVRAVSEGAQDYLIKGEIDGRILSRSIYYAIERKKIEKELMKTQKDLRKLIEWHEEELKDVTLKLKKETEMNNMLQNKLSNALKRIKTEKSKIKNIITQIPVGILIIDAVSGEPLIKNKKLDEIWGDEVETEELAEYCYYNGFHADGTPYELNDWPLTRSITFGEKIKDQKIIVSKDDGSKSVINNSSIPIMDDDGKIIMGMSIFSDICESRVESDKD